MSLSKRVLVSVLCLLVLASTASAALTKMTKQELHNLIKKCQPAAVTETTPADYLKRLPALKDPRDSPASATTVSTDKAYGASLLELGAIAKPYGIGVGELGDSILINDYSYGDIWRYRNGNVKYLLTPSHHNLGAGRMYGHYYFGDYGGNVFRLESDGSVTPLFDLIDGSGVLVNSLAVEPTTGLLAFTVLTYAGHIGTLLVVMDPADPDAGFLAETFRDTISGLAFKGNYLYLSLTSQAVINKYNWKSGAGPYLFTSHVVSPGDIQFDAKGNLFVTELARGDIIRFNASATSRQKIAWGFRQPTFLGLDRRGDIFVTDIVASEVWKIRKK